MSVKITIAGQEFRASLSDSPAARDLVAALPLTIEMVDHGGDPGATGGGDELRGLLDRLGAVDLGPPATRAAPGGVDRRALRAQADRDATAGAARRARHERHLAV